MASRFSDKLQAAAYAKYRTTCPPSAITATIDFLKEKCNSPLKLALDVGCGTGLSSRIIAPYFEEVLGTDMSDAQLEEAKNDPSNPSNVKYLKCPAEEIPLADNSVNLITVSHALHWFDLDRFFPEVKRVLVPNGVLMVWRDCISKIIVNDEKQSEELTSIYMNFRYETSLPYWDVRNHYASQSYQTVEFPFKEVVKKTKFAHNIPTTMRAQMGWYYSWSPYQKMKENDPELANKSMKLITERSEEILGTLDTDIITEMDGTLILCRHC